MIPQMMVLRLATWSWSSFASGAVTGLVVPGLLRPALKTAYRAAMTIPIDVQEAYQEVKEESAALGQRRLAAAPAHDMGVRDPGVSGELTDVLRNMSATINRLSERIDALQASRPAGNP